MSQQLSARMRSLPDDELHRKAKVWQSNADANQWLAALHQRWADAARKEIKRRKRAD